MRDGILADDQLRELVHRGLDGARAAFDDGLAPTDQSLVRLDLEEHPARRNAIGGEFGDLHDAGTIEDASAMSNTSVFMREL